MDNSRNFRIFKNLCDDIGWDKIYYKEGKFENSWGEHICIKDATLYSEDEAKEKIKKLNDEWYCGEYRNENFEYEKVENE